MCGCFCGRSTTNSGIAPHLFTLTPKSRRRGLLNDEYRVTLWCEHAGAEHPIEDEGTVYALMIPEGRRDEARAVRGACDTRAAGGRPDRRRGRWGGLAGQDTKAIKDELALMKAIVAQLPPPSLRTAPSRRQLSALEEEGMRPFRALLRELDPNGLYAGLTQPQTAAGDYLWVCPAHERNYNPELPVLAA